MISWKYIVREKPNFLANMWTKREKKKITNYNYQSENTHAKDQVCHSVKFHNMDRRKYTTAIWWIRYEYTTIWKPHKTRPCCYRKRHQASHILTSEGVARTTLPPEVVFRTLDDCDFCARIPVIEEGNVNVRESYRIEKHTAAVHGLDENLVPVLPNWPEVGRPSQHLFRWLSSVLVMLYCMYSELLLNN